MVFMVQQLVTTLLTKINKLSLIHLAPEGSLPLLCRDYRCLYGLKRFS